MKNYTIEVKEHIEKPKKKEQPRKSSFSWGILVLAIFAGLILSSDFINMEQYIPKSEELFPYQLRPNDNILKDNESTNCL